MDTVGKNVLEQWAEQVRSGKYPDTHPDTKDKFGDVYPPSEPDPEPLPKEGPSLWSKNKWYIVGIIVTFSLSAAILWWVFFKSPGTKAAEAPLEPQELSYRVESVTPVAPQPDPNLIIELEKLATWERLQTKLIEEFFNYSGPGVRALCVSLDPRDRCITTADSAKKAKKFLENLKR